MFDFKELMAGVDEDLAYGQNVIVSARWILVLAGLLLALWLPGPLAEVRVQVLFILLLAVANFYLHAQLLMGKPALRAVVYGASTADLIVITVMVLLGGGFRSNTFVFYFPAILAFSVAFPPAITYLFTAGTISLYGLIALATVEFTSFDLMTLVARLIIMAAIAVCGSRYWAIERDRRLAGEKAREELVAKIRKDRERRAAAT